MCWRGFSSLSLYHTLKHLNITGQQMKRTIRNTTEAAERASRRLWRVISNLDTGQVQGVLGLKTRNTQWLQVPSLMCPKAHCKMYEKKHENINNKNSFINSIKIRKVGWTRKNMHNDHPSCFLFYFYFINYIIFADPADTVRFINIWTLAKLLFLKIYIFTTVYWSGNKISIFILSFQLQYTGFDS